MDKKDLLKLIRDKYPQYSNVPDEELYNLVISKFPQYKEEEIKRESKLSETLTKYFSNIVSDAFKKVSIFVLDLKNFFKTENSGTRETIQEATKELLEIKKKIPNHSESLDKIITKLNTVSLKEAEKILSDILLLIKEIKDKEIIPERLIEDDRILVKLPDEQVKRLRGSSVPYVSAIDQETKNILYAIRDNTAGFDIPAYDTREIDEDNAPATVIITYKNNGVIVATQTISKVGNKTTISVI